MNVYIKCIYNYKILGITVSKNHNVQIKNTHLELTFICLNINFIDSRGNSLEDGAVDDVMVELEMLSLGKIEHK